MQEGWKPVRAGLKMGDPEPAERFIGCEHEVSSSTRGGKKVKQLKYYMKGFLACVCDERCDLVIVLPLLLSNCIVDCGASLHWPAAGGAGLFREKLHFISFLIVAADNV